MNAHESINALHIKTLGEMKQLSNDQLLHMPSIDRMVEIDGRHVRQIVWRDVAEGENRIIVQHHDERGARMWADGFVITSDGQRRPLTEVERRLYD